MVVGKVAPAVMSLAQHKYASNVVEACFKHGSAAQRDLLIRWVESHPVGLELVERGGLWAVG